MSSPADLMYELSCYVDMCQSCHSLGALTVKKVFGEGSLGATIMSIAEAPGADEFKQKRPFVGKAGAFWEGMLSAVGWHRSELYVCNVVKCRPMYGGKSNKLSPNLAEVDHCKYFLEQQIAIVKPKLILAFGKIAGLALGVMHSANQSMRKVVGMQVEPYLYKGVDSTEHQARVMFTYYPSYLQNKPEGRARCNEVFDHLYKAKRTLVETDLPWD